MLVKNISSLLGLRVAGYIMPLLSLPYLVRTLEPEGYGILGLTTAITQYFLLLVNYGFDLSVTQKIAIKRDDKEYISDVFWNVIFARIMIAILGLLILYFLSFTTDIINDNYAILMCTYIMVLGAALFPQWLFQGKEQLGFISTVRVFIQVLTLPMLFFLVHDYNDVWKAALIQSSPNVILSIIAFWLINRRSWIHRRLPTFQGIRTELVGGWHLFISTAAVSLYTTSTTVILGFVSGNISVALFTSAQKLLQAAQGIYSPFAQALYPRINAVLKEDKKSAIYLIKKLMIFQLVITISISLILYVMSPYVVNLLFGIEYLGSVSLIRIMSVIPVIVGLSNLFGVQVLIPFGYKKEFSRVLVITGIVSIFPLYFLCQYYSEYGAAVSVVVTETFVTLAMFILVLRKKIGLFK